MSKEARQQVAPLFFRPEAEGYSGFFIFAAESFFI